MTELIPECSAGGHACIDAGAAEAFRDNGVLVLRNVLHPAELHALQQQTHSIIDRAAASRVDDPDYLYGEHDGHTVAHRIEYVIDKLPACRALLGHPFILRTVELLQGRDFIPTFDSCVFKLPGAGRAVPWHVDGAVEYAGLDVAPIFNVDFYLDGSDMTNCVWAVPRSNSWPIERSRAMAARLNAGGFSTEGAQPVLMNPGDVLLHNVRVLHGSASAASGLRRVLYYEFRPGEVERDRGPHVPEYIPLKQRVLLACLRHRAQAPYARGEEPFEYRPSPEFAPPEDCDPATYRYPHEQYWRPEITQDVARPNGAPKQRS